jgi:CheY-like chemotaxis protein
VVARDVGRENFLGQKGAAPEFQNAPDGLHEVRLLDGDRALSSHSHSRRYGWTAAVAMPQSAMLAETLTPIAAAALSGFAVAALAIGAVLVFAARIGGGIARWDGRRSIAVVDRTSDGPEALKRITAGEPVDLVLTDHLMPGGMTGLELSRRIMALGRDIRVVLISGHVPHEDQQTAVPMLRKPIHLADLGRVISEALAR